MRHGLQNSSAAVDDRRSAGAGSAGWSSVLPHVPLIVGIGASITRNLRSALDQAFGESPACAAHRRSCAACSCAIRQCQSCQHRCASSMCQPAASLERWLSPRIGLYFARSMLKAQCSSNGHRHVRTAHVSASSLVSHLANALSRRRADTISVASECRLDPERPELVIADSHRRC